VTPGGRKALQWIVAAGALGTFLLFARRLDWGAIQSALAAADLWLVLAAAVVNLGTLVTKALGWWLFLTPWGVRSGGGPLRATVVGAAMNNVLPWNAGDALRVWALASHEGVSVPRVLGAAALERVTGVAAGVGLLGALVWLAPFPGQLSDAARNGFLVLVGLAAAYLLAARWLASRRPARGSAARLGGVWRAIEAARMTPGRMGAGVAVGAVGWVFQLLTYQMAAAAVGLPAGLHANVALLFAVNLGFLVRLTPGGIGVFQAVYVATAGALGLSTELALAAAILLQGLQVVPVTLLGLPLVPAALAARRAGGGGEGEGGSASTRA